MMGGKVDTRAQVWRLHWVQSSLPGLAWFFLLWVAGLLGHLGSLAPTASVRKGLPTCPRLPGLPHQLLIELHIMGVRNVASELDNTLGLIPVSTDCGSEHL